MKVGIVTFHKPYNFGGCLQALATSYILSSLGHTPYFVDYWPKYHQEQYSIFSFHRFFYNAYSQRFDILFAELHC